MTLIATGPIRKRVNPLAIRRVSVHVHRALVVGSS
jgi:hypothetical protein